MLEEPSCPVKSVLLFGNKCGHEPKVPRYYDIPKEHKLRPSVIQLAINNIKNFYETPRRWLESLRINRESSRQQRSEAREANSGVLQTMLHYLELATMRVGFYKPNGEFWTPSMAWIAKQLGWRTKADEEEDRELIKKKKKPKRRGIKRVWRALKRLKEAGYIEVYPRFEEIEFEGEKQYKGLPAVRRILPKLFKELKISLVKLEAKRREAGKRIKQKLQQVAGKAKEGVTELVKNVVDFSSHNTKSKRKRYNSFQQEINIEKEKRRIARCYELYQLPENKELSAAAFYAKYSELAPTSVRKQE